MRWRNRVLMVLAGAGFSGLAYTQNNDQTTRIRTSNPVLVNYLRTGSLLALALSFRSKHTIRTASNGSLLGVAALGVVKFLGKDNPNDTYGDPKRKQDPLREVQLAIVGGALTWTVLSIPFRMWRHGHRTK